MKRLSITAITLAMLVACVSYAGWGPKPSERVLADDAERADLNKIWEGTGQTSFDNTFRNKLVVELDAIRESVPATPRQRRRLLARELHIMWKNCEGERFIPADAESKAVYTKDEKPAEVIP